MKTKTKKEIIWCFIYFLRNIMAVITVFMACSWKMQEAVNFLNFLNWLMFFAVFSSVFYKNKFISFLTKEKQRSQNILYFSRACWWFCIIFLAIYGWIFSAMLWFSAWFIIFNIKNQIKI